MSLREQMSIQNGFVPVDTTGAAAAGVAAESLAARRAYQQLKVNIHQTIIERVELDKLQRLSPEQVKRELAQLVERIVEEDKIPMNELERRRLAQDVHDEMVGLGPLEPLLNDPTISDILVNTSQHVYVERRGRLEHTDVTFYDDAHLMKIIERIVTIEDAAELQLRQQHVLRLETRPPNIEGKGEISQRSLVRNALRMRPDRIVLGEVRGAEALDMLHAMNTGHEGSMATLHANTPRDGLTRLENMVSMAGLTMPIKAIRQQIASAITVVVQASRLTDGRRKLMSIQEITGMEGDIINMQEIFTFKRTGVDENGMIKGYFCATGVRPKFCDRLAGFGITLPDQMFDPARRLDV